LKKADGTEVATQTITSGATVVDGCLVVPESAFSDTTDGVLREIEVVFNDKVDYSLKLTFEQDDVAPSEVTELTSSVNNSKIALSWTDPTGDDIKELAVTVTHEVEGQPVEDIYEKVNKGVQSYTTRRLLAGTYTVKLQTVDASGNKSAGETIEVVIS
jgi:tartrate dehydratase alpha subunit/fumarate hydratase class I-like protein